MIRRNNQQIVDEPTVGQILAIEKKMAGDRRELFQSAFDVLREARHAKDDPGVEWKIDNLKHLYRGFERVNRESRDNRSRPQGVLHAKYLHQGAEVDLGLASVNVVTNFGVNFIIDAIQGLATITNLKWHHSGEGGAAEGVANTNINQPVGSRVMGSQTEGSSANIYKTVATLSYGSSFSIVEHGLFAASTGASCFDRSVFSAIAVDTSTSIEFTYEWTLNAGG